MAALDTDNDFSIGVEEEFQIVDPTTRDLKAHIEQMITHTRVLVGDRVKPEMMQSIVETAADVCANIEDARREIVTLRRTVIDTAKLSGLRIVAAGTHPFSHWQNQLITSNDRYKILEED